MAIPGIQEIQALATKYSKPQLQKMAQMGLIDPTKAVMAGMMIDRIQQQNMQPPQQTVAEEVMGAPQPPQQMPQAAGVAGLPSNLPPQMAGGGIVAFADGGDIDEYADGGVVGYADGNLVQGDPGIIKYVDPNWADPKRFKRRLTPDNMFAFYAEELARLTAAERQAEGLDKVRIQKDIAQLQSEMRGLEASPAARSLVDQILLPSAGAENLPPINVAKPQETSSAAGRAVKKLFGQTEKTAEQAKAYQSGIEAYDNRILDVSKRIGELSGPLGMRQQTPEQQAEYDQLIKDRQVLLNARNNLAQDISKSGEKPKTPEDSAKKFDVVPVEPAPAPAPKAADKKVAEKKAEVGPPRPDMISALRNIGIDEPEKLTPEKALEEQDRVYTQLGVDKDLFSKIRQDYEGRRGKFSDRADKAAGHALMMFGAGLLGARRGEEFATASKSAQQSLMMYMSTMDKLADQEDRLDQSLRELTVAEDQYKRTRADSALARVQKNQDKIEAIRLENAKLELTAQSKAAEFVLKEMEIKNPAMLTTIKSIAYESGKSPLEIFMMANGVAKTGNLTLNQALEAVQRNPMFMGKTPAEQMQEAQRMVGGGGGGGATYNYVPGKGLVPAQ